MPHFNLQVPVIAAPMFLVSGPALVIAACRAGVVGSFPTTNARTVDDLEHWMHEITQALVQAGAEGESPAPWCANLITHRSNARLVEDLRLVAKYRPPLIVTALGSPAPALAVAHEYGATVLADVTSIELAEKALRAGADGLACICSGAGGHTGHINPFAFVSAVRELFDGPLVVGGGITDGYGVAGAIAAGADLVYMGTRFIATQESLAQDAYKQMVVDCGLADLIVSAGVTGTPASWLKPSLQAAGYDTAQMPDAPPRSYDSSDTSVGTRWRDVWSAGQGLTTIRQVQPVASVVAEIAAEFAQATQRLSAWPKTNVSDHALTN